jgi:pimeloyl-ACP methyl ester carboxylesterase
VVADAVGVLDAYGIPAAHVVGVSAGGAFAQLLALDLPARVLSLVLISTSPATSGERGLPSATERYLQFLASAEVDWSDEESVIEYLVGYARVLAGGERPFAEGAIRELVRRDVECAHDIRASENHGVVAEGEVSRSPSLRSPPRRSWSTAPPIRCFRSSTDTPGRGDPWREPAAA